MRTSSSVATSACSRITSRTPSMRSRRMRWSSMRSATISRSDSSPQSVSSGSRTAARSRRGRSISTSSAADHARAMSSPTLTVKDVWRGVLPPGTDLLGGGGGLERRVEWACALRTRPPAFEAVKGGEIAFVPVKSIRLLDERLDLPQVMVSFAEKGGVAVAVVGDVSVESIAAADRLMMPLLRLPDGIHATDAHHTCIRFILAQRALLHERAQALQLSLMARALRGGGPDKIIERLAVVHGLPAAWQDQAGRVRHLTV